MVDWKGEKDGVKDTVTQKQKDALFPQTTFPLLFPFFSFPQLFPFLTLLLCHHPLSMSTSTSLFCTRYMHIHNEHNHKPTQHPTHFILFLSCSKNSFVTSFFNKSSSFILSLNCNYVRYTKHDSLITVRQNTSWHMHNTSNVITQTINVKKSHSIETSQNWSAKTINNWNGKKEDETLTKSSHSSQR